jgi:16S rRNA G966 N2-methylase RsmD
MSLLFGCSKRLIGDKLKEFGIKPLSKTDRILIRCPETFSKEQSDIIYGSLLGDGHISKSGKTARFGEMHCLDQKEYLEWKHSALKPFSKEIKHEDQEMPSGLLSRGFHFCTCFHPLFVDFKNMFYPNGEKQLPFNFEERLNGLILAIWYMDDGHLDGFDKKGYVSIASAFKESDIQRIVDCLNSKDLDVSYGHHENNTKGINIIRIHNTEKFFEMTKEYIVDCMKYKIPRILGGVEKIKLGVDSVDDWFNYLRKFGMVFPYLSTKLFDSDIKGLTSSSVDINGDEITCHSVSGTKTCMSIFNNMFSAKRKGRKSAIDVFNNDKLLKHVLNDCVKYYGKITDSKIRQELNSFGGVNNFKPVLAKYIYNAWCPENGKVLDPCSGWGGRLCGFMVSNAKSYTGVDVETESVKNLVKLYKKMSPFFPEKEFKNYKCDFTQFETDEKFDLVFTSPPYFDAEVYGDDKDQSCVKFDTYEKWESGFLKSMIEKSWSVLNDGGRIILNVPDNKRHPIADAVRRFMKVEFEYKIVMNGRYGGTKRFEWLLVSEKKV